MNSNNDDGGILNRAARDLVTVGRCCGVGAPDRSGRTCDKPAGHAGDHWTFAGDEARWPQGATVGRNCDSQQYSIGEMSTPDSVVVAEMLAALKLAESLMADADFDHEPPDDDGRKALEAVRAAIAKAEGKATSTNAAELERQQREGVGVFNPQFD